MLNRYRFIFICFYMTMIHHAHAKDCTKQYTIYNSSIDFNKCTDDLKNLEIFSHDELCECNSKFKDDSKQDFKYFSDSDKLFARIIPTLSDISNSLISIDLLGYKDFVPSCQFKDILEPKNIPSSCLNDSSFKRIVSNITSKFSKYGRDRAKNNDFTYNISNFILYRSYGVSLPDSKLQTRKTCYDNSMFIKFTEKSHDVPQIEKNMSKDDLIQYEKYKNSGEVEKVKEIFDTQICNNYQSLVSSLKMACPDHEPSISTEDAFFKDDISKFQRAMRVAESDLSVSDKVEKYSYLCSVKSSNQTNSEGDFDYIVEHDKASQIYDSVFINPEDYEEENQLCSLVCKDAPGPYPVNGVCKLKDYESINDDINCEESKNTKKCLYVKRLYERQSIIDLEKEVQKVVKETNNKSHIVSDEYDSVLVGVAKPLVAFLGIDKKFYDDVGVKVDLVTESEAVAKARTVADNNAGVKDEYRESGKVKKEWVNAVEIRDEFAGSGKGIDSGAGPVLNASGLSSQGSQVVIPRSPEAKRINELVEKVKVAKARTQVFRERVDKLEREGKGVDIASRWNNPISSLGSFENNWGVGSDNPAIRGYNSDGTSFEYPAVFNNRFGGVDAGRGRGYGARGRELNDNEKFTKAMYDRGLKTNISGASNESVADGSSGGGGSAGSANSGGGILSSGGTSAGGASRGPASGGSEMSEIAQHFKGLLGGEAAVKRDIKDVEMKQVRVFRNDYNDEGKVVLEELLAEHKDIKIGDPFIVYQYDNGDTYRATLLPLFDPDGKLQGYRVDKNDLVGKSREFANSIIASENFLR